MAVKTQPISAKRDKSPLRVERVAVDSLSLDPSNARKHPARNLETIKGSLNRFGQQKPIVVDKKGIVRAGNGTLIAAKELGWTHIDIVRSELSRAELAAFGVADNRTAELAEWDAEILTALLPEVGDVGFNEDEIRKLENVVIPPEGFQSYDENIETEHKCPKCGYAWSGGENAKASA